ncbi:MAG: hypothetical protein E7678_00285 [Ruminococcaceae bacterium]|nr:hypothetical protein [Oscillospiraceae bacterium]
MKKILAFTLVILMLLSSFVACKKIVYEEASFDTDAPLDDVVIQTEQVLPDGVIVGGNDQNNSNGNSSLDSGDSEGNGENLGNGEQEEEDDGTCPHAGGEEATCKTESVCSLCGKSYGGFDDNNHEGEEKWVGTASGHKYVYSCCGAGDATEVPHNYVDGVCKDCQYACAEHNGTHSCSICNAFIKHTYSNNTCSECGLVRNENKVTFGSYPQSKVTNSSIISTLNAKNATFIQSNGTWYADVENGTDKYRGVKTTQSGTATWFKYEPISWTVLEEKDGKALVLCDMVIEMLAFDESNSNNYAESTIRAWLNETFINTAFGELAKTVAATIEVDNGNASTGYVNARFTCDNTYDKIFLLSRAELKNTLYGFTTDGTVEDANRKKQASEYAIARLNGGYVATSGAWWWMRTGAPHLTDTTRADLVHNIKVNGTIYNTQANSGTGGVVPAMWIYI